jgi:hypothetical protein
MTFDHGLAPPLGNERGYALSYRLAFDRLAQSDLNEVSRRSGASLTKDSSLRLSFLEIATFIDVPRLIIESTGDPLSVTDKLVILHYLVTANEQTEGDRLISFKELPEGSGYFPTFYQRAIAPVLRKFENSMQDLPTRATAIGGSVLELGDVSVAIRVLPHVTLNWVLWKGDGLLPAEGSILFDSSITNFLPVEDIAALCQSVAMKLCNAR